MDATALASWLAPRGAGGRQVRPAPWVDRKWLSRAGKIAWVSVGGVRQGAASHQMPNPAEPRRNR